MRAGDGAYEVYSIDGGVPDRAFVRNEDYVSISAVRWFANLPSNFLSQNTVAGTVKIKVGSAEFEYALDSYDPEDDGGAPVADREILAPIPYRGGELLITALVSGVRADTKFAQVLRGVATASLQAAAGAVSLGTGTAAAAIATAATSTAIQGVTDVLSSGDVKRAIFSVGGFTNGVDLEDAGRVSSDDTYLLLHRGTPSLDPARFEVKVVGATAQLRYAGERFEDGAWILFRIRRRARFGVERTWKPEYDDVVAGMDQLMDLWRAGGTTKELAKASLVPASAEPPNHGDKVIAMMSTIRKDRGILARDQVEFVAALRAIRETAIAALDAGDFEIYRKFRETLDDALTLNRGEAAAPAAFVRAVAAIAALEEPAARETVRARLALR